MQFSNITKAVVALSLVTLALAGFAAIGVAEETEMDEIENSTIETTNETEYIEWDVVFADSFENTSTEDVQLTIYNETEYNESGDAATAVIDAAETGEPGESFTNQYNLSDYPELEQETEYRVIVETGNENNIESGYVAVDDESVGGGYFGDGDAVPGFGAGIAVAAAAIGTALLARVRAGGA